MINMIVCDGDFLPAVDNDSGADLSGMVRCAGDLQIVPYVEPTDSTAIYSQLVALNEFDPEKAAFIIVICLATFLVGFGAGVVVKLLRRL